MLVKLVIEICTDVLKTEPLFSIEERLKMCSQASTPARDNHELYAEIKDC